MRDTENPLPLASLFVKDDIRVTVSMTLQQTANFIKKLVKHHEWMNECVFVYRTYHIVSQGGLQFYLSEIGRQLVEAPLAAAIRDRKSVV